MALMILLDTIVKALQNGDYVIGIYLDFSKAFDTVDHGTLLLKLEHNGVRGSALKWFKSVPQGSVLGPLLFLLYITDLTNVCKCTMPMFFADDTNLFINGSNINEMESLIISELAEISKWLKVNKLSLNINKTHYMIFTTKRKITPGIVINIEGHIINEVEFIRIIS